MFPIMVEISETLLKILEPIAANGEDFDVRDTISRFNTDVISSCAYGIEINSLENPDHIFRKMGMKVFEAKTMTLIRNLTAFFLPDLARKIKV